MKYLKYTLLPQLKTRTQAISRNLGHNHGVYGLPTIEVKCFLQPQYRSALITPSSPKTNLAKQEGRLAVANAELGKAQALLDEKQAELDKVQAKFDAAMNEKMVRLNTQSDGNVMQVYVVFRN